MTDIKNTSINDLIATIEKAKQDFRSCKIFLKDKNNLLNNCLKLAFELYEKHNDKGGFLRLLFDYDKDKGWSKPSIFKKDITEYFNFCEVDYYFNVNKQKLFIDYDKKDIVDYLSFKESLKDNKQADKDKKEAMLLKIKLPFKIDNLTIKEVDALLLQANLLKKQLLKKESKKD